MTGTTGSGTAATAPDAGGDAGSDAGPGGRPGAAALALWAAVGALGALGLAGLLTVGVVLLAGAGALAVIAVRVRVLRAGWPAAVAGAAAGPALLAWLDRGGPGRVCETTATSLDCHDALSPWPFVAAAVVLVVAGAALVLRVSSARGSGPRPSPRSS
ncbi:MAG: hypothetical protein U0Q15_09380 [Kineosporiaceae bacterium]